MTWLPTVLIALGTNIFVAGVTYGAMRQRLLHGEGKHAELAKESREGMAAGRTEVAALRERLFAVERTVAILDDRWKQMDQRLVRIETGIERVFDRLGGAKG
jgi:hypothetical protein